jgi:hypothetical protein
MDQNQIREQITKERGSTMLSLDVVDRLLKTRLGTQKILQTIWVFIFKTIADAEHIHNRSEEQSVDAEEDCLEDSYPPVAQARDTGVHKIVPGTQNHDEETQEEEMAETEPTSTPVTKFSIEESVTDPIDESIEKATPTNGNLACKSNMGNAETDILSAEASAADIQVTQLVLVAYEEDAGALPESSHQDSTSRPCNLSCG